MLLQIRRPAKCETSKQRENCCIDFDFAQCKPSSAERRTSERRLDSPARSHFVFASPSCARTARLANCNGKRKVKGTKSTFVRCATTRRLRSNHFHRATQAGTSDLCELDSSKLPKVRDERFLACELPMQLAKAAPASAVAKAIRCQAQRGRRKVRSLISPLLLSLAVERGSQLELFAASKRRRQRKTRLGQQSNSKQLVVH